LSTGEAEQTRKESVNKEDRSISERTNDIPISSHTRVPSGYDSDLMPSQGRKTRGEPVPDCNPLKYEKFAADYDEDSIISSSSDEEIESVVIVKRTMQEPADEPLSSGETGECLR
jgi:hypothetical protein